MKNQKSAVVGVALALGVTAAQAALPTEAGNALTALQSNITDILAGIWPIVIAGVGGFKLIGLFKRGAAKV